MDRQEQIKKLAKVIGDPRGTWSFLRDFECLHIAGAIYKAGFRFVAENEKEKSDEQTP